MRDYRLYLKDILAAIESIEAFVEGMDFEAFRTDDKTASAVIRKFEIIGEAAKHFDKLSTRGFLRRHGEAIPRFLGERWPE